MAMTNEMIILMQSIKLMEEGVLRGTGKYIEIENEDGTKSKFELPEEIHTYEKWKSLGYQVRKGEKSTIKFDVWYFQKPKKKAPDAETSKNEQTRNSGKCWMRLTSFFTIDQVDKRKEAV